jgi:ATP-binding cassette subfamily B protein
LIEPLGALEEADAATAVDHAQNDRELAAGVAIELQGVSVRAAGHELLHDLHASIPAGSQIAIVGASGAGKSTLAGLLLGWHRPTAGRVVVDGRAVEGPTLRRLRMETAWVDPSVQLWNRTLLENLQYGGDINAIDSIASAIDVADLREVLERMPEGLQTPLGEGGGSISGGEGQRVRLARAALRPRARLVVLDEPFRGLERDRRRELLDRARRYWRRATMLCITHDIGETLDFDRVLVLAHGRIVEDGRPSALAALPDSRYRAMLDAEDMVREGLWRNAGWRTLTLSGGRLAERGGEALT